MKLTVAVECFDFRYAMPTMSGGGEGRRGRNFSRGPRYEDRITAWGGR
jgi:hypothetical protein